MKLQDLWIVEYSPSQKSIHIDSVGNTIARNGRNIRKGVSNDYMTVGLYETSEIAHKQADRFSTNMLEALGLLIEPSQHLKDVLSTTNYGLKPYETEILYQEQESNLFRSEKPTLTDTESIINYDIIADKLLMRITEEDFEKIRIYKVKAVITEFDIIYSCQNAQLSKIYFTPNEHSYTLRGFRLREEQEIETTEQLIEVVRKWRNH